MDIVKLFRVLIVANLVVLGLFVLVMSLEPDYPEEIAAYLDGDGSGAIDTAFDSDNPFIRLGTLAIALAFICTYLSSLAAMWKFKPWARHVYLALAVLGLIASPFMGSDFNFPFSGLVITLSCMCDGALIALLFTEGIRGRFHPSAAF